MKLGSSPDQVEHDNDVLSVDYYGHFENRPILKWTSPQDLQITVPNLSTVGLKKNSYQGLVVTLKYDPDDPAAREKWRTEHGLPKQ